MNRGLMKSYVTSADVAKRLIVKLTADGTVAKATAATDSIFGVADSSFDTLSGERLDVVLDGIAECVAGGNITRGALVTADSSGYAVAAAPSAGVNNRVLGIAMKTAVSGDIVDVLIRQHQIQGA